MNTAQTTLPVATAGNTFDIIAQKLVDEQMASDINHLLELVESAATVNLEHIDRYDNPHKVTKAQVGLGNVDNTSDLDKPLSNAATSAINTLRNETVSAITTLKAENKSEHDNITQTTNSMFHQIQSAVQTLDQTNQQEHQDTLTLLDSKITEVKGLITALDNKIISATATLKTLFAQADTEIKNEITTAYQVNDTQLQAAINSKAPISHNHDSVYAKIGTLGLTDGSVKSNHIADNAITSAKIADGTIKSNDIANATITGAKLVNKTITAKQIADNTITANQLAPNSVGESELGWTQAKLLYSEDLGYFMQNIGISGKITTQQLVTAIINAGDRVKGTTTFYFAYANDERFAITDMPEDILNLTITFLDNNGLYIEGRPPFSRNALYVGSTSGGTWHGWKQVRNDNGQAISQQIIHEDLLNLDCVNTGLYAYYANPVAGYNDLPESCLVLFLGSPYSDRKVQLAIGSDSCSLYVRTARTAADGTSNYVYGDWRKI